MLKGEDGPPVYSLSLIPGCTNTELVINKQFRRSLFRSLGSVHGRCDSSKAESAYTETQLSEFVAQYKNADMPHLRLYFHNAGEALITMNTSDMPAALDAIGNMCASLQAPLELKDKLSYIPSVNKVIGPFSRQLFKLKNFDYKNLDMFQVALSDALEPLGWKADTESVYSNISFTNISFTKVGGA